MLNRLPVVQHSSILLWWFVLRSDPLAAFFFAGNPAGTRRAFSRAGARSYDPDVPPAVSCPRRQVVDAMIGLASAGALR